MDNEREYSEKQAKTGVGHHESLTSQYEALTKYAFEQYVRSRLLSYRRWREDGPPPLGIPPATAVADGLRSVWRDIDDLKMAATVANFIAQSSNPWGYHEGEGPFRAEALDRGEWVIADGCQRTAADLEKLGYLDLLDKYFERLMLDLGPGRLSTPDVDLLREIFGAGVSTDLTVLIADLKAHVVQIERQFGRFSCRRALQNAEEELRRRLESPPQKRRSRRWWKGLSQIGGGCALGIFDSALAVGALWFPIAPDTQIVGSATSIVTGMAMVGTGVGEFRGE